MKWAIFICNKISKLNIFTNYIMGIATKFSVSPAETEKTFFKLLRFLQKNKNLVFILVFAKITSYFRLLHRKE